MYGGVDLLLGCLKNLDEHVLNNALVAAFTLLSHEEGAQDLVVRRGAVKIIGDSLKDYKSRILVNVLKCLALLLHKWPNCKEELRTTNNLKKLVKLLHHYPSEEVDASVFV